MDKFSVFLKNRFHVFMIVIVTVGLVFLLNQSSLRWDLTRNQVFTLSAVSKDLVKDLNDPLRVKVFMSKNLPPPLNDLPIALEDILIEYQEASDGNFIYNFYDVTEDNVADPEVEANIKLANDYGINANQVQTLDKDQIQLIKVYSGVVIEYGNLIERLPFITDSARLEYQITTILDKMNKKLNSLLELEEPIEAKLYLTEEFVRISPFFQIQGLSGVADTMKTVFEKVNQQNYGQVNFSVVTGLSQADQDYLIGNRVRFYPWNEFRSPDGKTVPAGRGVAVLMVRYQDRSEWIEILNPQANLQIGPQGLQQVIRYILPDFNNYENTVDGIIDSLLDINDYIAYLDDKETVSVERSPGNNPLIQQSSGGEGANFFRLIRENYTVERIQLADLNTKYKTLVIAGAKQEFSDYDLFLIDQYLMQGRSLMILQDGLTQQPSFGGRNMPTWAPVKNGLEKLLENYGVRIQENYVMDKDSYSLKQQQNGGVVEQQIYFAPKIQDQNINHDFIPLKNFKLFIALEMSPVDLIQERVEQQNITATRLFSSGINSWIQTGDPTLIPMLIKVPEEVSEYQQSDLAYAFEGEFTSYFSGKPIPSESPEGEDEGEPAETKAAPASENFNIQDSQLILEKSKPAKMIVVGSSALIKNNLIDERGEGDNAKLMINLLDYLSDRVDWTIMRTKNQRMLPLEPYNPDAEGLSRWLTNRSAIKWFNMLGLPLLVVLIGLAVYGHRNSRRKKIMDRFSEPQA